MATTQLPNSQKRLRLRTRLLGRHQFRRERKRVGTAKNHPREGERGGWRERVDTSAPTFVIPPSEESGTNSGWRPGGAGEGEGPASSFRHERFSLAD